MHYEITNRRILHQGFFRMDFCTVEHDCYDGRNERHGLEIFERGDAAAVVLYDSGRDEVLLTEQFRIGPAVRQDHAWLTEVVAGMIDNGESPEECARRECIEEAGYAPSNLKSLGCFYVSPGGTSERIFLYMGEVDAASPVAKGGGVSDEHEDIRTFWVKRDQAMAMVRNGRINSSGPMLALLLAFGVV